MAKTFQVVNTEEEKLIIVTEQTARRKTYDYNVLVAKIAELQEIKDEFDKVAEAS